MGKAVLKEKIKNAPMQPGCYLYYDRFGNIIYVGKAKNLKSRVKSYFTKAAETDSRTEDLVPKIVDVEFKITNSELDALILEYQLIKQYKPWFNSVMKADKPRPFLRIDTNGAPYSTFSIASDRQEDGAEYYDCFTDEDSIRATLLLYTRLWGMPQCGKASFARKSSPCMYHSIAGCMAPCAHLPLPEVYGAAVKEIQQMMGGEETPRIKALHVEMEAAATALEFEKAAQCKKNLEELLNLQKKCRRLYHYPDGSEVMVLIRPFKQTSFAAFYVRDGYAMARHDFSAMPSMREVTEMLKAWRAATNPLPAAQLLAQSLIEISAAKAFVVLPAGVTDKFIYKHISMTL